MSIKALKDQYSSLGAAVHFEERLYLYSASTMQNEGFMGASQRIVLYGADSMAHQRGACLAGPVVNLYAKHAVHLGSRGNLSSPMKMYTPWRLSIKATHLWVGDIEFLVDPVIASIACDKITFCQTAEEEPEYVEKMTSWLKGDHTEVEKKHSQIDR